MGKLSQAFAIFSTVLFLNTAQSQNYDWMHYGNDPGHTKYAPLDQINRENVADLEVNWIWESIDNQAVAERPQHVPSGFKATPITRNGTIYVSTPLGFIAAIDAQTGQQKWVFNTFTWEHGRPANNGCLLYTSPSPRDGLLSRMPSSA